MHGSYASNLSTVAAIIEISSKCHTVACEISYADAMYTSHEHYHLSSHSMFNPHDYIDLRDDGFAMCSNPMADGGLEAIMVNTRLVGENLRNFEGSIKRMVLGKLFSPKFGEVILTATRISVNSAS